MEHHVSPSVPCDRAKSTQPIISIPMRISISPPSCPFCSSITAVTGNREIKFSLWSSRSRGNFASTMVISYTGRSTSCPSTPLIVAQVSGTNSNSSMTLGSTTVFVAPVSQSARNGRGSPPNSRLIPSSCSAI